MGTLFTKIKVHSIIPYSKILPSLILQSFKSGWIISDLFYVPKFGSRMSDKL